MPRYRVVINRVEYHRAEIEVEADDEDRAEEEALDEVGTDDYECVSAEEDVASVTDLSVVESSE